MNLQGAKETVSSGRNRSASRVPPSSAAPIERVFGGDRGEERERERERKRERERERERASEKERGRKRDFTAHVGTKRSVYRPVQGYLAHKKTPTPLGTP